MEFRAAHFTNDSDKLFYRFYNILKHLDAGAVNGLEDLQTPWVSTSLFEIAVLGISEVIQFTCTVDVRSSWVSGRAFDDDFLLWILAPGRGAEG